MQSVRYILWHKLSIESDHSSISLLNIFFFGAIFVGLMIQILETEPSLSENYPRYFLIANWAITIIFTIEYFMRFWVSSVQREYRGFRGKIRYIFSFWAIIDLIAILPSYFIFLDINFVWLRTLRLLRILKLGRLGAFSRACRSVFSALRESGFELLVSFLLAMTLLLCSATMLYLVEGNAQPEAFGSIPRAVWWSVATLTTVGYGDVYPITLLGKIFAGITAILGIGVVALPTGVFAAALGRAFDRTKRNNDG